MAPGKLALKNIQGNILGGFNKDFQTFIFLKFKSAAGGRAWINEISDGDNEVGIAKSSSKDVLCFNGQFKALKAEGKQPEFFIDAAWTNIAISFHGLKKLAIPAADLQSFPAAFKAGMAARKNVIGDLEASDPSHWEAPFGSPNVHALMVVAADDAAKLAARVSLIVGSATFIHGVKVLHTIEGRTRMDLPGQPGHEHFGFKDGVSQPGIRGVNLPDDPVGNPDQGHPGQDLLWPGEFVLGYPTQIETADPDIDGLNTNPGMPSVSGPSWTVDGSYLVFRKLAQDVPGFRAHVGALAAAQGLHPDLMGAKLVGRYKRGCPIEKRSFQPDPFAVSPTDPDIALPGVGDSDTLNNNFEFKDDDASGAICPLAAHIRKAYPRDEVTLAPPNEGNSESDTQTHRLLRRGIPFGGSFGATQAGGATDPRGLLFQCYQKDIENQFEFVQKNWVNASTFPPIGGGGNPGEDPIIAQSASGPFQLEPGQPSITVEHFVTTNGGEYFFAPSIDALQKIGANTI